MAIAVQMRAKGNVTILFELRQKYGFDEGDVFTLVELGDGSLLLTRRVWQGYNCLLFQEAFSRLE